MGEENGNINYKDILLEQKENKIFGREDDPYIIIHTAAVDTKPRGGVLSQKNIVLITLSLKNELNLNKNDSYLNILPIFHIMGINLAFATFIDGGTNVVIPSFDRDLSADLLIKKRHNLDGHISTNTCIYFRYLGQEKFISKNIKAGCWVRATRCNKEANGKYKCKIYMHVWSD